MWRDTNTSKTLAVSGKIIAVSSLPLTLSAIASFFAWIIYEGLIFDEMHIISTDYQLRPGLTLGHVTQDIFVTFNTYAFFAAVIVLIPIPAILHSQIKKSTQRITLRIALACWIVLCSGPLIAALQYYFEMRYKLN